MSNFPDPYVPPEGYQVPAGYGQYGLPVVPGAYDPLVPPPGTRFDGWWSTTMRTWRRSIMPLMVVFALTVALPSVLVSVLAAATGAALALNTNLLVDEEGQLDVDPNFIAGVFVAVALYLIFTMFLNALGWATGIHVITQCAYGGRASLADAFRAGIARALPMWGWYVVVGLMCAVGTVLCVLPGLYLMVALSMFSFVVIFERGTNPISRSFQLVHSNFGAALGRVALLYAIRLGVAFAVSCVIGVAVTAVTFAGGAAPGDPSLGFGVNVVSQAVQAILQAAVVVPLDALMLVGLMITYTQLRSALEPVSTPQLVAEAR